MTATADTARRDMLADVSCRTLPSSWSTACTARVGAPRARARSRAACWRVRTLMAPTGVPLVFLRSSSNQLAHRDFATSKGRSRRTCARRSAAAGSRRRCARRPRLAGNLGDLREGERGGRRRERGRPQATRSERGRRGPSRRSAEGFGVRNCLFHAPEAARGARRRRRTHFGTRADAFSFGVVLWCLATPASPWEAQAEHEHPPRARAAVLPDDARRAAKRGGPGERAGPPRRSADTRVSQTNVAHRTRAGERDPVVCLRGKHRAVRRAHRSCVSRRTRARGRA